jgi:uncharacterized protein (TIGR02246 family)
MKPALCLLLLLAAPLCCAQPAVAEIEALEQSWMQAVMARDYAALGRLYADDLIYAHSSGVVDTKAQYLEKLRSGRQSYKAMEAKKITVRLHGTSAVSHLWARFTGTNPNGAFDDKLMVLHLWVKQGNAWRLAAHQTTKVTELP